MAFLMELNFWEFDCFVCKQIGAYYAGRLLRMMGYKFGENNVGTIGCIPVRTKLAECNKICPTLVDDEYESSTAAS